MSSTSRTPFPYSKTVLNMPVGPERNAARARERATAFYARTRKANNKPVNNLTRRISNIILPNAVVPNTVVPNAVVPNNVVPNNVVPNNVVPNNVVPNNVMPNNVVPNELPPEQRNSNEWEPLPDSEIDRLQQTLYRQLNKMKIRMAKPDRINFVKNLLEKQNNTCVFGKNVKGMYCWNKPEEAKKKYLNLQWGHIKPKCRDKTSTINDFFLQCARCNNQIQTGRYLCQLKPELQSKLEHIDDILRS
jgi:hypothetical protein